MMGRQTGDQSQLFYLFNLEELIPASHLLRRINPVVSRVLAELRENLTPFYSDIGRPSIDQCGCSLWATATVSALREGSVRRLSYTSLIGGSVGSISTTKYLTTRRSRSIAMVLVAATSS